MKKNILLLLPFLVLTSCGPQSDPGEEEKKEEEKILFFRATPEYEDEICLANDTVKTWYDDYSRASSITYQGRGDIYYPKPVKLTWEYDEAEFAYYQVKVGNKENLSDAQNFVTISNELLLEDLFIGEQYYWKVYGYAGDESLVGVSETMTFYTLDYPRTLNIEGVSNTRDIGGKTTTQGKRVKQGMVYRSANLDSITDKGKQQALYRYNIKTDLDLRNPGEGLYHSMSPIGREVNYINVAGCYWIGGSSGLDVEANFSRVKDELKVFTNINNYPIDFHCAIGQDRTGSLALVLGALLGVNGRDLMIDYELSSFCSVVWDAGPGIMVDAKLNNQYLPLFNYINSFGNEDDDLMTKAELYCKRVGLTDQDIATIRNIMLED